MGPRPGGPEPSRPAGIQARLTAATGRLRSLQDRGDPATVAGRSRERYRRAAFTTLASLGSRGITIAMTIVTTPLALQYLGAERYGLWMTISSVIVLLSLSDLGLGNSVMNEVSQAHGLNDEGREATAMWSGFALLLMVAAAFLLGFALIDRTVNWADFFSVTTATARAEAGPAVTAFVATFVVGLPLGIASQVRLGRQQGFLVHLVSVAAAIIGSVLLVIAILTRQTLPILVLSVAIPPVVGSLANFAGLIVTNPRSMRLARSAIDVVVALRLLRGGALFFVLQIAMAVGFASDSIVAARVIGPVAVAEYSITQRLFNLPIFLVASALAPLWPAYREALARGDTPWVRKTLVRSLRLALAISVPAALVLTISALAIIDIWVGQAVRPPLLLVVAFGCWTVLGSVGTAVAMFLNGAGELTAQAATAVVMATVNIVLSIALAQRLGVGGVMLGTVIAYTLCTLLPLAIYLPRVMRRVQRSAGGGTEIQDDDGQR